VTVYELNILGQVGHGTYYLVSGENTGYLTRIMHQFSYFYMNTGNLNPSHSFIYLGQCVCHSHPRPLSRQRNAELSIRNKGSERRSSGSILRYHGGTDEYIHSQ